MVRDYFNVEAETLDEAIEYVKNMGCPFDDEERKKDNSVEFLYRDWDTTNDNLIDCAAEYAPERYSIYSLDLDCMKKDGEVVNCE